MTIVETVLVFIGIPLGVIVLVAATVYGRSAVHQPNRYRPGRAWTYPPQWYLPHPQAIEDVVTETVPRRAALEGQAEQAKVVPVGGANGEW